MEAAVTQTEQREDLAEKASEFLLGVLERMGISADIDIKDDSLDHVALLVLFDDLLTRPLPVEVREMDHAVDVAFEAK